MPLDATFLGSRLPWPWTVPLLNIDRAKFDVGRLIPCTPSVVLKYVLTAPVVGAIGAYINTALTSTSMPNNATKTNVRDAGTVWDGAIGASGTPDFPRNAVITVTHGSSIVAVNGVISGIGLYGSARTEAWSVTAGGTTKTFTGKVAFARINQITIIATADATANSLKLGTGNVFGLPFPCHCVDVVAEMQDGAVVGTEGVLVAASTSAGADKRGTYAPNATPDGVKVFTVYYLSDDPRGI